MQQIHASIITPEVFGGNVIHFGNQTWQSDIRQFFIGHIQWIWGSFHLPWGWVAIISNKNLSPIESARVYWSGMGVTKRWPPRRLVGVEQRALVCGWGGSGFTSWGDKALRWKLWRLTLPALLCSGIATDVTSWSWHFMEILSSPPFPVPITRAGSLTRQAASISYHCSLCSSFHSSFFVSLSSLFSWLLH